LAVGLLKILGEIINHEARVVSVEVEEDVVRGLVEVVVVDRFGLVEEYLLAVCIHCR